MRVFKRFALGLATLPFVATAEVTTMNCSNCTAMTPPAAIVGSSFVPSTRRVDTGTLSMGMTGGMGGSSASYFLYAMKGPNKTGSGSEVRPASGGKRDKFSALKLDEDEEREVTQFATWLQESIPAARVGEPIFDALKVLSYVILNGPAARKDIFASLPAAKNRDGGSVVTLKDAYENAVRAQNEMVLNYVAGNPKGGNNANLDYLHTNLSSLRMGLVQSNLQ